MLDQTYNEERTIEPAIANLLGIVFAAALTLLLVGAYRILTGDLPLVGGRGYEGWVVVLGCIIAGVPVHEVIHAATFRLIGRVHPVGITFGFNRRALAPFVHCSVPVSVRIYRISAIMPGLLLGVLPIVIGILLGSGQAFIVGYVLLLAALGDAMILVLLHDLHKDQLVQDHASKPGFVVLNQNARDTDSW